MQSRRRRLGLDSGIDPKIAAKHAEESMINTFNRNETLTAGKVSGMSYKRSDDDYQNVTLIDPTEEGRNFMLIQ